MKRRGYALAAALLLLTSILPGCGNTRKDESKAGPGAGSFKVAMVTDAGGPQAGSLGADALRGLQKVQADLNADVKATGAGRPEEYEATFQSLIDLKYDLIWGIGFPMTDAVDMMSKKHPSTKFALIDSVVSSPNVASITFKEEEGAFLEGIIAAGATRSRKVGFVGGMNVDATHHSEAGFRAGVKAADPRVEVITLYANSFLDPAKGKQVALALFDRGADVVFHAAGATGAGVIEAAREKNRLAIGSDTDQKELAPDHVISSMIKRADVVVLAISQQASEDRFPGGRTAVLGLKENGVGYSDTTAWGKLPAGTRELADKWAEAIKAGKVTVPHTLDKFGGWEVPKL